MVGANAKGLIARLDLLSLINYHLNQAIQIPPMI
jgi:hypothetical protein